MKKILMFSALLFLVLSCSKSNDTYTKKVISGIEIVKNKKIPFDKTQTIKLKKETEINLAENDSTSFFGLVYTGVDSRGNVFVLDRKSCSIAKFDISGNLIKLFAGKGKGPGEFENGNGSFIIKNDNIMVIDYKRTINYDNDGNYLNDSEITGFIPAALEPFKGGYLGYSNSFNFNDGKVAYKVTAVVFDENLSKSADTYFNETSMSYKEASELSEYDVPKFVAVDSLIYVYEPSENDYTIRCYDSKGEEIRKIKKSYAKIKMNDKEVEDRKKSAMISFNGFKNEAKSKSYFFNSLRGLYGDKEGRLLALNSKENEKGEKVFDIFKDGIYLNSVSLDFENGYFKNGKFIDVDNENRIIKVYNY